MSLMWRVTIFDQYHPQVKKFEANGFPLAQTWAIHACTSWTTRVEITLMSDDGEEFDRITVRDAPTGKMPWRVRVFYHDAPDVRVKEFEDLENAQGWVLHAFGNRSYYFEMFRVLPLEDPPKTYVSDNAWKAAYKYRNECRVGGGSTSRPQMTELEV